MLLWINVLLLLPLLLFLLFYTGSAFALAFVFRLFRSSALVLFVSLNFLSTKQKKKKYFHMFLLVFSLLWHSQWQHFLKFINFFYFTCLFAFFVAFSQKPHTANHTYLFVLLLLLLLLLLLTTSCCRLNVFNESVVRFCGVADF